ncbi:MAG: carboxymuconolactone decarboxylase family protein [Massilia sp.]
MDQQARSSDLAYAKQLAGLAPREGSAFLALKASAERADGQIPEKYRELISVAVALTTQCGYCIEAHVGNARRAGASAEELAETVFIVAALRAGAAVGHGLMALRVFEEAGEAGAAS